MKHRGRILLFVFCSAILAGLYGLGQRKSDAPAAATPAMPSAVGQQASNTPKRDVNFAQMASTLAQKLPAAQRDTLAALEKARTQAQTPAERIQALEQLAQFWDRAQYVEVAALYYRELAQNDSTLAQWQQAAQKLGVAFRISNDTTLRQFLVENALSAQQNVVNFDTTQTQPKIELASTYIDGYIGQPQVMNGVLMLLDITKKQPDNVPANLLLGRMAIVSGQFDKAIQRLERVVTLQPDNPEAYYMLGEAYLQSGNKEKAVEMWQKCKKLVKSANFAAQLQKDIDKILK